MAETEMETGDDILSKAALDGSMDYSAWPELLPTVLARIEKIAHTEFPIPNLPRSNAPARPASPRFLAPLPSSDPIDAPDQTEVSSSQGTNKENADPSSPSAARRVSTSVETSSVAAPGASGQQQPPLPKPIADMLDEILSVLRTNFAQYPPHTIQRLSELVLRPRPHYRHLVPYLHALDRVVHVTSGANTYPLPPALPDVAAMSLLANGAGGPVAGGLSIDTAAANTLGSDEALGGALLTPIPWLSRRANGADSEDGSDVGSSSPLSASENPAQQFSPQQQQQQQQQQRPSGHLEGRVRTESTETIEGPNGMGSIETVSVSVNGIPSTGAGVALLTQRSVTQGELLRQEQRAGLVPLNQLNRQQQQQEARQQARDRAAEEDTTMKEGTEEEEDEVPHARGPEEIGPADMGPQSAATTEYIAGTGALMNVQAIDVEAAVGRRVQSPPTQPQQEEQEDKKDKRASGSPELIPQSPKREAPDSLEPAASPAKRRKEEGESNGQSDTPMGQQQSPQQQTHTTTTLIQQQQPAAADGIALMPKRDAEGDVVLTDAAATETVDGSKEDVQITDPAQDVSKSEGEAKTNPEGPDSTSDSVGAVAGSDDSPAESKGG